MQPKQKQKKNPAVLFILLVLANRHPPLDQSAYFTNLFTALDAEILALRSCETRVPKIIKI